MSAPGFLRLDRRRRGEFPRGFTLLELLVAMAVGSVVFGAVVAATLFLQKSYAATEQYAVNLADQSRLMDYLTLDLRRATDASVTTDGSGQTVSLQLTVPNYYADADLTTPNVPLLQRGAVYYGPPDPAAAAPTTTTVYRRRANFTDPKAGALLNVVTRQEADYPEVAVAAGLDAFPEVVFDAADGTTGVAFKAATRARLKVVFRPRFQTPATPSSNLIVLHGLTYLRNHDRQRR